MGSNPTRVIEFMAHSSNGQDARFSTWKWEFNSPMSHSIGTRTDNHQTTHGTVAQRQRRTAQNRDVGSSNLPSATSNSSMRSSRCSVGFHKADLTGPTPVSATFTIESARYAKGKAASMRGWCLWVRIPSVSLRIREHVS